MEAQERPGTSCFPRKKSFLGPQENPMEFSRGIFSDLKEISFLFSEISEDFSEMNEEKSPQEPPSTLPRILHGKEEGLQSLGVQSPGAQIKTVWL